MSKENKKIRTSEEEEEEIIDFGNNITPSNLHAIPMTIPPLEDCTQTQREANNALMVTETPNCIKTDRETIKNKPKLDSLYNLRTKSMEVAMKEHKNFYLSYINNNLDSFVIFPTFFDALYWATTALTTVGYGDISGETNLEK